MVESISPENPSRFISGNRTFKSIRSITINNAELIEISGRIFNSKSKRYSLSDFCYCLNISECRCRRRCFNSRSRGNKSNRRGLFYGGSYGIGGTYVNWKASFFCWGNGIDSVLSFSVSAITFFCRKRNTIKCSDNR